MQIGKHGSVGTEPQCCYFFRVPASGISHLSDESVERRLTTILAADVFGYSRLMGDNEAGTIAELKAHRK